jgi:DNA-binding beta-propeller fold protein YncE
MQSVTIKSLSFFMGLALLALLCLAACDDKPTEPKPAKDYSVYFINALYDEGNWYFAYHPTTNQLDSFWLPYTSAPLISADGKKMYVSNREDSLIAIVDLKSLAVIDQLPYKQAIAVSPDNQLIAVLGEGVHILQTSDYADVFHDTVTIWRGTFSRNSQRFYGATSDWEVYTLDMSQAPYSSVMKSFAPFGVKKVVPSVDETKWFLYLYLLGSDYFSFQVYDPIADSIMFRQDITPGDGELELTPNGKLVFYTNPGNEFSMTGDPWIIVYDVAKNDIQTVTTAGILEPPYQAGIPLSEVGMTPDNRWLVAVASGQFSSYPFVVTLDINTMLFVKHRMLGGIRNYHGLECQLLP